jgi:hypothetical protein
LRRVAGLAVLLAALSTPPATAELAQKGDLFVHFDGGISPKELPRASLAPIGVRIGGRIRIPTGHEPPALRRIVVALNRGGRLSSRGLPICRRRQIASATPPEALAICGQALVGTGGLTASTSFPNQPAYLLGGETLLFNTLVHGHPAILAHVFQRRPSPIIRFIVFHIRHRSGSFGTLISANFPASINSNGYLRSIYLQLQRNYVFHGRPRAYISASCATPAGVAVAAFPFASVSMSFEDGRTLSSTLIRTCRAR